MLSARQITNIDSSVKQFQELLVAEFTNRWNALATKKKTKQESLFGADDGRQTNLSIGEGV